MLVSSYLRRLGRLKTDFIINHLYCFQYVGLVASLLQHFFSDGSDEFFRGNVLELETKKELLDALDVTPIAGGLKYVIHTCPGEGPEVLGEEEALLGKDGMPRNVKV